MQDGAVRETGAPAGGGPATGTHGGGATHMRHEGHEDHDHTVLCEAGRAAYARALTEGRVPCAEAAHAPCLVDSGLLYADPDDASSLRPSTPLIALPRLLDEIEESIARHRGRASRLATAFEPFLRLGAGTEPGAAAGQVTVLKGVPRIRRAVWQALADASDEVIGIQPANPRQDRLLPREEPWRMAEFAARGGSMRTLALPHTTPGPLPGVDCEVRTLDELPPCLLVFDRDVAFIPAAEDGRVAFELRSPALVTYVVTAFDILWRLATPLHREDVPRPPDQAVGPVQRDIASLLTEGLTDTEIAGRLDMNVRTAREHIARLAAVLGSNSRAQLGFLISRSGLLD
ncbi:helix-turn-helix transcriptional regulator [Streptomyces lasiicapitis]|uniref:helix-turn-helix transcriptional regulator n=1 Tax=Streptomyces lasiicapitis TaxID=1923961 RepID=UPI003321C6BA